MWLIWPNDVSVWLFGFYGIIYTLGLLLKNRKYDGEIAVSKTDVKTIFGVALSILPERLAMRDDITFRVVRREIADRSFNTPYNEDN